MQRCYRFLYIIWTIQATITEQDSIGNFMRVSITLKRGGRHNQGRRMSSVYVLVQAFLSPTSMTLFLFRGNRAGNLSRACSVAARPIRRELQWKRPDWFAAMFRLVGQGRFSAGGGG